MKVFTFVVSGRPFLFDNIVKHVKTSSGIQKALIRNLYFGSISNQSKNVSVTEQAVKGTTRKSSSGIFCS